MLVFKVKNTDICICAFKQKDGFYGVTSCDNEGHEGLLAEGLLTLKELEDLIANVFGSKVVCCGKFTSHKQMSKILSLDLA